MRWVVGSLLVGAALLKAAQLVTEPATALLVPLGSWFLPAQIGAELGLGFLALGGIYWRRVRWAAVVLFAGFAAYSLNLALDGAASCGCFGALKIHPGWTFALDGAVVVGLLFSIWRCRTAGEASDPVGKSSFGHSSKVAVATVGIAGLCAILLVRFAGTRTASADDFRAVESGLVVLEPQNWIGRPLPIADSIDLDLSKGDWIVLLHRHDCPACQEAVPHYEARALVSNAEKTAIVEVPPYDESAPHGDGIHARLSDERDWFVQTPVEIRLSNGVVTTVSTELPQLVSH